MSTGRRATRRIIVVGSGIAGLTAARHAARRGAEVMVVTKDAAEHGSTRLAQGGIAGVLFPDDRAADHARDTLTAGAWHGDPAAVELLVAAGPERIRDLVRLGVDFDRQADGTFVRGLEAAHSYPRVIHAGGDATGAAIERALLAELRRRAVAPLEHAGVVDLVLDDGRTAGVELLIGGSGERRVVEADAVVLATGGLGELYAHSTNPRVATGDGLAIALRAGAGLADLEFVQFHPTVLAGTAFLVSEAVRGEGAVLVDDDGRRFAFDHHPDGELAPRDVLARAIAGRMAEGHTVRLDATRLGRDVLAARFPTIDAAVRARGLDWAAEPIPVTPAAHYLMGGVVTDLDGRTSVPGLYAVGEVARTGVHGANRLASNSLLEGAVFGARAGEAAAVERAERSPGGHVRAAGARAVETVEPPAAHGATTSFSRTALQRLMWQEAGLVRHETGLRRAAAQLAAWRAEAGAPASIADHEDANLLEVGIALVAAARERTESLGAHHRIDSPPLRSAAPVARPTPSRRDHARPVRPEPMEVVR